jgi:hypothetical protein
LPNSERKKVIEELLTERTNFLVEKNKAEGKRGMSPVEIMSQDPGSTPTNISQAPRPSCYTKNAELRRQFRKENQLRRSRYDDASMRFRLGDFNVQFPDYSYKPPLHRKPRLIPFTPLNDDYFKKVA